MNALEFLEELIIGVEGSETSPLGDALLDAPDVEGTPAQSSVLVTLGDERFEITVYKLPR